MEAEATGVRVDHDSMNFPIDFRNRANIQAVQSTGEELPKSSYPGQNAFGAHTDVTTRSLSFHFLAFPKSQNFRTEDSVWTYFVFRLRAPASEAKELKEALRMIALCRLRQPHTNISQSVSKPTLSNPIEETRFLSYLSVNVLEFWLYNSESGDVTKTTP